ncbi:MAG TPA: NAD-dependent epimerase/dehydratase family protein, partial [Phnomibacter sp.]|nr:NAD-dependent epimerase/dehydratase family protein [Phnomibacter sp.]
KAHLVPHNAEQAADFFNTNLKGTQHLCQWLQKGPVMPEAFVFISTVSVYGVEEGKLISETHPLAGTSPYAQSKIQAEAWLQQWCSTHGVALTILRLPLIAGINAPGNLGAMINAIKGGKYFNIGEGNAQKSIVLAEDVAQWIPVFTQHPGIYNLTDGQHPSFAQLAALIASQLGKGMPRSIPHWLALPAAFAGNYMGARAPLNCDRLRKITATLTFDDTKARQVFGWKPKPVLEHFKIN